MATSERHVLNMFFLMMLMIMIMMIVIRIILILMMMMMIMETWPQVSAMSPSREIAAHLTLPLCSLVIVIIS